VLSDALEWELLSETVEEVLLFFSRLGGREGGRLSRFYILFSHAVVGEFG
jgi:hypothetical protein